MTAMSKERNAKKEVRKKAAMTPKERKAMKKAKKDGAGQGFGHAVSSKDLD